MKLAILLLAALPATGQLRVTAQTLSAPTTRAMFGALPRQVTAASVQACNQTSEALTVPLARIVQQVRLTDGWSILPRDAALVIVSQAQGRGKWATAFRYVGAATGTVSTLSTLQIIKPNTTIGSWIIIATAIVGVASSQFSQAATTHNLLAVSSEALPDPLQLPALGCASGITLVERVEGARAVDFPMTLGK